MKVNSMKAAWAEADKMIPMDYELDSAASARAGYSIYRSTSEYYFYICDLNDRLEVNFPDGTSVNIWIEEEEQPEQAQPEQAPEEEKQPEKKHFSKSMLTADVLDRFEKIVDVDSLSAEQIKDAEQLAYCACMGSAGGAESWQRFRELIQRMTDIKADFFSESEIADALAVINETLYQIEDKIGYRLREKTGINRAHDLIYGAFGEIGKILKAQHPGSDLYERYNLKDSEQ